MIIFLKRKGFMNFLLMNVNFLRFLYISEGEYEYFKNILNSNITVNS